MSTSSGPARAHIIGVIPARLASTRLPRKVLRDIAGKPMLAWVYAAAWRSRVFDRLLVATDSEEVADLCRGHNWECRLTSAELASGTDRVHAVAQQLVAEGVSQESTSAANDESIFVNIQGDEPLLRPEHFHALLRPFTRLPVDVSTVMTPCPAEEINRPSVVKVVVDRDGKALYFSRAPIPWNRDGSEGVHYWKHLGLYAYKKRALDHFSKLPPSRLEVTERLEQLRLLENGIGIHVEAVEFDTIGVDTEEDMLAAAARLSRKQ